MRGSSIETVYVGCYSDGAKEYDVLKNTHIVDYFTPMKTGIPIPVTHSIYQTSDGQLLRLVGNDLVLSNGNILTQVEL
ncbi:hypothetical protein [Vibrio navarrensis]|uniref:hypothetical protein n=1 Tax=Vibrio navarrensis TaxID=29495 RepID=UPI0033902CD6